MEEIFIYGFNHYLIETDEAKESLKSGIWLKDNDNKLEWWKVAELPNGDVMYEDNCLGVILILTNTDISYYRYI